MNLRDGMFMINLINYYSGFVESIDTWWVSVFLCTGLLFSLLLYNARLWGKLHYYHHFIHTIKKWWQWPGLNFLLTIKTPVTKTNNSCSYWPWPPEWVTSVLLIETCWIKTGDAVPRNVSKVWQAGDTVHGGRSGQGHTRGPHLFKRDFKSKTAVQQVCN